MDNDIFNNKLPNLKHLHYLVALDKYKHFNKAAQACFVSQSTLSSAILKLEEQLDCQLLEREHKSFVFTSHGKDVIKLAQQLLLSANELVAFAKQKGDFDVGSIRLGCIPTIAPFLLTDLVQLCQQQLPKLEFYLCEDTTDNLMSQLEEGRIDCALLAFPIPKHHFSSRVLGKDRFYIAGDNKLINALGAKFNYDNLPQNSVFLLNKEHCLTEHAVTACQLVDIECIHSFSATSLATLVQMTTFHHGVTFLPEMAVNKGVGKAEGLTIEPISDEVYREIGMIWRKTSMREKAFSVVGDLVIKLLKK